MVKAVVINQVGGPEVLQVADVPIGKPGPGQIRIRHKAIEVNYIDVYHRTGAYPLSTNPKIPGVSAVGEVIDVGPDITNFSPGERVAYATASSGAYCAERNIAANLVFTVKPEIDDKTAAAILVKGMTGHYLATRVFVTAPGKAVLIHAAAGGVGQALTQFCRNRGAYVIGTVGSEAKKKIATDAGCHEVINYSTEDWVAKVKQLTEGHGVNAVYDSVGKDTFKGSIDCLTNIGIMILYGASSGPVTSIDTNVLAAKSLFFTRPSLFHYKKNRMELILSAEDLWQHVVDGIVIPKIFAEFPLENAAEAHKLLESRQATGSIILIP